MGKQTTLIRFAVIVLFFSFGAILLTPDMQHSALAQTGATRQPQVTFTPQGGSGTETTVPTQAANTGATSGPQSPQSQVLLPGTGANAPLQGIVSTEPGKVDMPLTILNMNDVELVSPSGAAQFRLTVPDNWTIQGENRLNLAVNYIEISAAGQGGGPNPVASLIKVLFDDKPISTISLTGSTQGRQVLAVQLPTAALADPAKRNHTVRILFDAQDQCQANDEARLTVLAAESTLHLEYKESAPSLNLMDYPRPFFSHSLDKSLDTAVLVVPANRTQADLEAATTIAAGLGQLTVNRVTLRVITADALTDADRNSNLIVVGQTGANALIDQLYAQNKLPTQLNGKTLVANKVNVEKTDGVIQLVASPFNPNRAVLAITGQSPEAVQKAAQSLVDLPTSVNARGPVAIIAEFRQPQSAPDPQKTVFTLSDLGYTDADLAVSGYGTRFINIDFSVPLDMEIANSAFIDLKYDYSSEIKNARITVTMLMNGTPFASKLLDNTSASADGTTNAAYGEQVLHAPLPIGYIYPGLRNNLAVIVETQGDWGCFPPNQFALFFNVNRDSTLNLPMYAVNQSQNLAQVSWFPSVFNTDPTLNDVLFSLPEKPSADELAEVMNIAARLGTSIRGNRGLHPHIIMGALPEGTDLSNYHVIIIGQPSTNPLIRLINDKLPQPFAKDSDEFEQVLNNVSYRLAASYPLGAIQMLKSAWSPKHMVLVITGSTPAAQVNAANALLNTSPSQLRGDIVFVSDNSVSAVDSAKAKQSAGVLTAIPDLSTKTAANASATAVALQSTAQASPSTPDNGATATPTLLFTYTPSPTIPTMIPTFPPLTPNQNTPASGVRPPWVDLTFAATLLMLVGIGIYFAYRTFRRPVHG